jgi:hypothetical protein
MRFFHGPELTREMKDLLASPGPAKIAVAYWGRHALKLLELDPKRKDVQVVCCLKGGKSAPEVIRQFGKGAVQNDALHAKVIWTPSRAIVGSANASSNGMPTEETFASALIETGVLIEDSQTLSQIETWFDDLYRTADPITDADLRRAQVARTLLPNVELVDIPLEQLKAMKVAIMLWAVETTAAEDREVFKLGDHRFIVDSAGYYIDTLKNARQYPYDHHVVELQTSEDRRKNPTFNGLLFFPMQDKWHRLKDGSRVIEAHYVPPSALRLKIGSKSLKVIRDRLRERNLTLEYDLRQARPGDGFVSWEPLHRLLTR